ncbi:LPS-assembly protein LptD [Legionella waltersii]|uniref:LPS-assembly protein LptD n=1 Tax=Legionella waltersii TaxID=66969 RepID=A0A0W1ADI1_9GAMM|nr:LPS-assembly protein LptD [Legionella waltersii]KTD79398.1 organic solvent tolerance protein [Legionella waltersii]SNU97880.1 organic solvent tolerance protein [Legionella waltersii]
MTFYKKLISFLLRSALLRRIFYFSMPQKIIKFIYRLLSQKWLLLIIGTIVWVFQFENYNALAQSVSIINEPIQACVIARDVELTDAIRAKFAQCLGWISDQNSPLCLGEYQPIVVTPLSNPDEVKILADQVSFYKDQRSTLSGHVMVQQGQRIVNAQTAYVYRDPKTNEVTKIELLGDVRFLEPDRMMIARKAIVNPQNQSGEVEDVIYRFNTNKSNAVLPAWGRAGVIKRFANQDYFLSRATYTTCAPSDKAWDIQADTISLDQAKAKGVARNATLRIHEWPVFYSPYLSFPTSRERKSGFLMPLIGYSNVGGMDLGLPYYWNLAPNHDMTLIPHYYSKRGFMMGGQYRFLTPNSNGVVNGSFLPDDRAFKKFVQTNQLQYPSLQGTSANRWEFDVIESTRFSSNLRFNVNVQQVSDDYYLQDFRTNLALITQRQLLRQADLVYTTENWTFRGMGQSYQTLEPINETPISPVYERLPQIMARGYYYELPMNATLNILGQYDQFHWPANWSFYDNTTPEGPRFHFNPIFSIPFIAPWGYLTPSVQLVENYYNVNRSLSGWNFNQDYNLTLPRFSVDGGVIFERDLSIYGTKYVQTLEPRLFYLNVPYTNQTAIPVYDSGFMIFNVDQLFRTNRFSGFDRIGDANQLSYALTTRWLDDESGAERANFSIGQINYFSNRRVQLCQSLTGFCLDAPNTFANLSSVYGYSPVASRLVYNFNQVWGATGDYVWDPATKATNNADLNLHYQVKPNAIINGGYSYLVNGDMTQVRNGNNVNNSLHQAIVAATWPFTEKWSSVGAYSYNLSKKYSMMSLLGVQYDNCCWAVRVIGGRTFKSLNAEFEPKYNTNIYLQLLLKGLGSVASSDPSGILGTYLPGYRDPFRRY